MKKIVLLGILFVINYCYSQEKIPFNEINHITELVKEAVEKGNYENTVEILNRVNKNDSAYCGGLVLKSYYLLKQEKYKEAINSIDEGFSAECADSKVFLYINKTVALLNEEKFKEAILAADEAIKTYPYNYKLWFNKGISHEALGETQNAVEAYKKVIVLNPFFAGVHLKLGNILYKQEKISQAIMCFDMYLFLNPKGSGIAKTIESLNFVVGAKNSNTATPGLILSQDDSAFKNIDLILDQKVALNTKYKTGNKIDLDIVKQNHALLYQLNDFKANGGFWDKKYIAFYKWIQENNYFDDFIYTILYSIEDEKYQKIIKKNQKDIDEFYDKAKALWSKILSENDGISYYYYDSYVQGVGKLKNSVSIGEWTVYNENGQLASMGSFDSSGEKDGLWKWFYPSGNIKESADYKNGKLEGNNLQYFENAKVFLEAVYIDNLLNGEFKIFNENGALTQKKYFKDGELNGIYKSYFSVGEEIPEFNILYENGKATGKVTEYYANKSIYAETAYDDDMRNGSEIKYHFNNKISSKTTYVNNKLQGSYESFYSNGNKNEVGQSVDGLYQGPWKIYYPDGTLWSEFTYEKGNLDGLYTFYDTDGKIYYTYTYRKGEIISYKFFDKQGNIVKEESKKGGEFQYTSFSPLGILSAQGLYDISGGKIGEWKFYSTNGTLSEEGNFINNEAEGLYRTFYKNGQIDWEAFYNEGILNGYYVKYYKNGQMMSQGWYMDGNEHGEWRNYFVDGTLANINFFHKGKQHGEQQGYGVDGKLMSISKYKYGQIVSDIIYNPDGSIFETVNFENPNNKYTITYHHFNNSKEYEMTYVNGIKHGPYVEYYLNGNKKNIGNWLNGELDGENIWYNEDGSVKSIRNYLNGQLDGTRKDLYENGAVEDEYFYEYGDLNGIHRSYYDTGKIEIATRYDYGMIDGRKEFYSESGTLQLIRFYDKGRLIGYSYLDKKGEELPMIAMENETGIIKAYYPNGNVSREMEYKNGELVYTYISYYEDGTVENSISYKDDEYNGEFINYYPDGKLKEKVIYLDGLRHGTANKYYENGTVKEKINYLNSNKHGPSFYYTKDGKIIKTVYYINDKIYKIEE